VVARLAFVLSGIAACGATTRAVEPRVVRLWWEQLPKAPCQGDCHDRSTAIDLVISGATGARIHAAHTSGRCEIALPPSNSGDLLTELRCQGPHDDSLVTVRVVRIAADELLIQELSTPVRDWIDGPPPTHQRELGRVRVHADARVIAVAESRNDKWR